jgi:hypothetical protein
LYGRFFFFYCAVTIFMFALIVPAMGLGSRVLYFASPGTCICFSSESSGHVVFIWSKAM